MMLSVLWQPTDPNPKMLASIAAHREAAETPNLLTPLHLDVMSPIWPVERADALVCINMIHIAPWPATSTNGCVARTRPGAFAILAR